MSARLLTLTVGPAAYACEARCCGVMLRGAMLCSGGMLLKSCWLPNRLPGNPGWGAPPSYAVYLPS